MKQVKINIEQKGRTIAGTINLPECWDEVPTVIYPFLAQIYLSKLPGTEKTVLAFLLLVNDPVVKKNVVQKLLPEELYDLLPLIDWVFDKMDLKKNLAPRFVIKRVAYIGPEDALKNMRFSEWVCADTFFTDYTLTASETSLNNLIATIYRPTGRGDQFKPGRSAYWGDAREKFNDSLIEHRAGLIKALPLMFRQAIALWFASCRWQLKTDYPKVFESDEDEAVSNPMLAADGWFGIYDDLRGDPKFGGPDKLEEEYIHTIFQSLTRSHYKMKALRKEYDL